MKMTTISALIGMVMTSFLAISCVAADTEPEASGDGSEEAVSETESAINPNDAECWYYSDSAHSVLVGYTHWNCTLKPYHWGSTTNYMECDINGPCE